MLGRGWLVGAVFVLCGLGLPSLSGLYIFPFSLIPDSWDLWYRLANTAALLLLATYTRKSHRYHDYSGVFFSFFLASAALNLQVFSAYPPLSLSPIELIVARMLLSTALVVLSLMALTLISGRRLGDIFVKRGNLRLGLGIGFAGFLFFALTSIILATYLFQGQGLDLERVAGWAPLVLVTVLSNGFREEMLYRGVFLREYSSVLGPRGSNLVQAVIFSLSHTVAGRGNITYTPFTLVLVAFTFILGLAWGYLMQRSDSLLGSIIFHAGSDIPVFLGIFSNL